MIARIRLIAGRELWSSLVSPATWAATAVVWLYMAFTYLGAARARGGLDLRDATVGLTHSWMTPQLLLASFTCMRLLSEERRTGTFEALVTAPVRDFEIVLGKFFSALATVGAAGLIVPLLLALTIPYGGGLDVGQTLSATAASLGLASVFCAVGVMLSAMTSSMLLAGFLTVLGNLFIAFLPAGVAARFPEGHLVRVALARGDLARQASEGAAGILDLNHVAYQAVATALFLFFAVRALEARKWT